MAGIGGLPAGVKRVMGVGLWGRMSLGANQLGWQIDQDDVGCLDQIVSVIRPEALLRWA